MGRKFLISFPRDSILNVSFLSPRLPTSELHCQRHSHWRTELVINQIFTHIFKDSFRYFRYKNTKVISRHLLLWNFNVKTRVA